MVFALESGSLIKLRKHVSIPKGFFSLKIMKGSFWVGECFHVPDVGTAPAPQGTSCAQDPSRPCSVDLLVSMFICNLYSIIYNKLVILSLKNQERMLNFIFFLKIKTIIRFFSFSELYLVIDVLVLNQVYIPGMSNLIVMYCVLYILLDFFANISFLASIFISAIGP